LLEQAAVAGAKRAILPMPREDGSMGIAGTRAVAASRSGLRRRLHGIMSELCPENRPWLQTGMTLAALSRIGDGPGADPRGSPLPRGTQGLGPDDRPAPGAGRPLPEVAAPPRAAAQRTGSPSPCPELGPMRYPSDYPGTSLAGGCDRAESHVQGRIVENEDLVNLPNRPVLTLSLDA
jgi:hypothetical protein